MLDLNSLILTNGTSPELTIQNQIVPDSEEGLEGAEESIDNEEPLDPSSFVVLFAEILNTTIENESESVSHAPVEDNLPPNKAQIKLASNTNGLEIKNNNQMDKAADLDNILSILPEQTGYTETEALQPTSTDLEHNVAMAWINSDGFEPPLSVSQKDDSEEILPEAGEDFAEVEEVIAAVLKKEMSVQNSKGVDSKTTDIPTVKSETIPFDNKLLQDTQEAVQEQFDFFTNLTAPETVKPDASSELNTTNLVVENNQNLSQTNLINNETQRPIETTRAKSLDMPVDINSSQWADKFSEHIIWLGNQGIKSALIKIHPEDLGPLEISIKVVKDNASVNISSQNSTVRDIVDQALPRLREMMAEQGLNLTDVHIGADANSRQFSQHSNSAEDGFTSHYEEEIQSTVSSKRTQEGLIDYFA